MGEVNETVRDSAGRFLRGHHLGRPRKPRSAPRANPVALAFEAAGKPLEEARKLFAAQLVAGIERGDVRAMRLFASLAMPKGRTLDFGLFRGTENAEQRGAAVVGALGVGALTPAEATETMQVVRAHAEAGEWAETRELHERARAAGTRVLPAGSDSWTAQPAGTHEKHADSAGEGSAPVDGGVDDGGR